MRRKLSHFFEPSQKQGEENGAASISNCLCCGSGHLQSSAVLWQGLIEEWGLSASEVNYVNRQQGFFCSQCRSNLRTMALAKAIMGCFNYNGLFKDFVRQKQTRRLRILEINEAGNLTQFLREVPGHVLGVYPEVDMLNLPYADRTIDVVLHSDTLEHVHRPIKALSECCRVLKPGGICAFTIPMIVDRLTLSRENLAASYHGAVGDQLPDWSVQTEYGCDAWKHVIQAGFQECRIVCLEYPAAHALIGVRGK